MASRKTYHSYGFVMWLLLFLAIVLPFLILVVLKPTQIAPKAQGEGEIWMSYGPKGTPAGDWDTAEEFLDRITATSGVTAVEVDRWVNSRWEAHFNDYPFNNFSLRPGEGYLIRFAAPVRANFDSDLKFTPVNSVSYQFVSSWNLISFPQRLNFTFKTSEELCLKVNGAGGSVSQVAWHNPFVKGDFWIYHHCGSDQSNFPVMTRTGYWLLSGSNFTWNLP